MAFKPGLRSLVLTPERIPSFLIPSLNFRSPVDRLRLLSDSDHSSVEASPEHWLKDQEDLDTDVTTRAAMSLPYVKKATTPYGFRAVLAASPCTNRRESLFHKNKPVKAQDSDHNCDLQVKDLGVQSSGPALSVTPPPGTKCSRSRECLRPVRVLGQQVMKELRKPAAALRAWSPAVRRRGTHKHWAGAQLSDRLNHHLHN